MASELLEYAVQSRKSGEVLPEGISDRAINRVAARTCILDDLIEGITDIVCVIPSAALHPVAARAAVENIVPRIADQNIRKTVAGRID